MRSRSEHSLILISSAKAFGELRDDISHDVPILMTSTPTRIADYVALVPQVEIDGNDVDGVHSVSLRQLYGLQHPCC